MIRSLYFALLASLLFVAVRADSWLSPKPNAFISENAAVIVRVEPGSVNPDASKAKPAHCRFFRYSETRKSYEIWREHDLVNKVLPISVVIPDDGSFLVTFDDYMGIGTSENTVVVYDSSGHLLKRWALNEILSETEIEDLPHSTMSIRWHGSVGVMSASQQEIYISPPPADNSQADKTKKFKGFMLNVKLLTIREDPRWK